MQLLDSTSARFLQEGMTHLVQQSVELLHLFIAGRGLHKHPLRRWHILHKIHLGNS